GLLQRGKMAPRPVLWVAPRQPRHETLYGPGLSALGFDPFDARAGLVLVRARGIKQILWAVEEGLREAQVGAVVAEIPAQAAPDLTASRRLQLAAEAGGTLGVLLRTERMRGALFPSACMSRWRVAPTPPPDEGTLFSESPCWLVELLRCRGASPGAWILEWQKQETHQERPYGNEPQHQTRAAVKAAARTTYGFRLVAPLRDRPDLPTPRRFAETRQRPHEGPHANVAG
ncbi:MAG: hypothetical protein O7A03_08920, partial [Alphaproteobacteria bacterium]|nr:hypothetical protein [Alphaproteobacteria bacterium]